MGTTPRERAEEYRAVLKEDLETAPKKKKTFNTKGVTHATGRNRLGGTPTQKRAPDAGSTPNGW